MPLYKPEVLTAEPYGLKIQLRWEDYNYNNEYCEIERSNNGETSWTLIVTESNKTNYFKKLNINHYLYYDNIENTASTFYYRIRSYSSSYSNYSDIISGSTANRIFYLSTSGSDSNDGTAPGSGAWRNMPKANLTLVAGDTLIIENGTYSGCRPAFQGTANNPICYIGLTTSLAIVNTRITANQYSQFRNIFISPPDTERTLQVTGSISGALFEDVKTDTVTQRGDYAQLQDCYNIIFRSCSFLGDDWLQTLGTDIFRLDQNVSHIMFDKCEFYGGGHTNITSNENFNNHVIIKNCFFWSKWHSSINAQRGAYNWVLENNFFARGGSGYRDTPIPGNASPTDNRVGFMQYPHTGSKVRFNIVQYHGGVNFSIAAAYWGQSRIDASDIDNEFYENYLVHNTFYKNWNAAIILGMIGKPEDTVPYIRYGYNRFKNNIFYQNHETASAASSSDQTLGREIFYMNNTDGTPSYSMAPPSGDIWENNLIGDGKAGDPGQVRYYYRGGATNSGSDYYISSDLGTPTIDDIVTIGSLSFSENIYGDPNFVSSSIGFMEVNEDQYDVMKNQNFNIKSDSICRNTGTFLTYAVNSGSGNIIPVHDAGYFYDGWDITVGDRIQVGNEIVRITSISGNNITISGTLSWSLTDNVSFPYYGEYPDIGSFEYYESETEDTGSQVTYSNIQFKNFRLKKVKVYG